MAGEISQIHELATKRDFYSVRNTEKKEFMILCSLSSKKIDIHYSSSAFIKINKNTIHYTTT